MSEEERKRLDWEKPSDKAEEEIRDWLRKLQGGQTIQANMGMGKRGERSMHDGGPLLTEGNRERLGIQCCERETKRRKTNLAVD